MLQLSTTLVSRLIRLFSRGPIYKTSDEERKAFLIGTTYRLVKNIGISAHFTHLLKFRNFVFFCQ